jgi:hypothetical protein
MYVLRDNKLVLIETWEQTCEYMEIVATREKIMDYDPEIDEDIPIDEEKEFILKKEDKGYIFRNTFVYAWQKGLSGWHPTRGEAIVSAIKANYTVHLVDIGINFKKELTIEETKTVYNL